MDNTKTDDYFLGKIKEDLIFIVENMRDVSIKGLESNRLKLDSIMFRMIQISANSKRLTEEYRITCSDIPWEQIFGLRNRIVHDYGNIDLNIVYDTLTYDIPDLLKKIEE